MGLLKSAVTRQRWDIVAHTIVLAAARAVSQGGRTDGRECRGRKKRGKA